MKCPRCPIPNTEHLWPAINDTSEKSLKLITELPEDQKIQMAVQRIIAGYAVTYTNTDKINHLTFPISIYIRTITFLKLGGYQLEETILTDNNHPSIEGFEKVNEIRVRLKTK